jgi:hypothetical protein
VNYNLLDSPPNGGDAVELKYWPRIKVAFPAYEDAWRELIVPLTSRPHSQDLRTDLPAVWESLANNHYSIFLHLAAAHDACDETGRRLMAYEDVYSHLASALDVVEAFLNDILVIESGTDLVFADLDDPKTLKELLSQWVDSEQFSNYREQVYRKGATFAFNPFGNRPKSVFEKLLTNHKVLWTNFADVSGQVRPTRNIFLHQAVRAKIEGRNGEILVPKDHKTLNKYSKWSSVHAIRNDATIVSADFVDIKTIVMRDINQTESVLNAIWNDFASRGYAVLKSKLPSTRKAIAPGDRASLRHATHFPDHLIHVKPISSSANKAQD